MNDPQFTGGCQCGAVRFRIDVAPRQASICHCRMCQKATGGLFGPYASFPADALIWTRGLHFPLSMLPSRLRCPDCGSRSVTLLYQVPNEPMSARATALQFRTIVCGAHMSWFSKKPSWEAVYALRIYESQNLTIWGRSPQHG